MRRPRRDRRLLVPVVAALLTVVAVSVLTTTNAVPASRAGSSAQAVSADTLKPSSCSALALSTVGAVGRRTLLIEEIENGINPARISLLIRMLEQTVALEHGQPLVFGKHKDKGIRMKGLDLEVVALGNGVTEKDLIIHDERHPSPAYAFLLSRMDEKPGFPSPIGVLRAVDAPRYEAVATEQIEGVIARKGAGDLGRLLRAGDTWEVK